MKRIFQLTIVVFLVLYSCANQQNNEQDSESDSNISHEEITTAAELSPAQKEVEKQSREFIKWYIENRDTLFYKRESVVQTNDSGYYYIDPDLLDNYMSFLKTKGGQYFSTEFVSSEKKFWEKAAGETKNESIVSGDGPNPWCFEADPIFMGQDWPDSYKDWLESWQNENEHSVDIEGNEARYQNAASLNLIKENGRWKLKSWE